MSYFNNETLGFWMFGIFVMVWRKILFSMRFQLCLHRLHPRPFWAAALQWYNVYFFGIAVVVVYSFYELCVLAASQKDSEYHLKLVFDSQNKTELATYFEKLGYPLENAGEVTWREFYSTFKVDSWLRYLNVVAISTVPVTLTLCVYQVYSFLVVPGYRDSLQQEDRSKLPFMPFRRVRYLLLIFILPTLYVASALRGNIRVWALLGGRSKVHLNETWEHVTMVMVERYKNDMEVANFLQYFAVWSFAALCGLFISEHFQSFENATLPSESASISVTTFRRSASREQRLNVLKEDLQMVVMFPAFIGVWAFIVVGFVNSASCFVVSELMQHQEYRDGAIRARAGLESVLKPILVTLTILAVINMTMLSQVRTVKDKLGNANLKFNGTRILILVGAIQESVISMFTKGSRLYAAALRQKETLDDKVFGRLPFEFKISDFEFSPEKGHILHVSLLLLECLLAVCLNVVFWWDFDIHNVEQIESDDRFNQEMVDASEYIGQSCDIQAEKKEFLLLKEEGGLCGSLHQTDSSDSQVSS